MQFLGRERYLENLVDSFKWLAYATLPVSSILLLAISLIMVLIFRKGSLLFYNGFILVAIYAVVMVVFSLLGLFFLSQ